MSQIAAVAEKLLICETIEDLFEVRIRRLIETVPFFETALCCIRLARKGLGEDELRRILFNKKFGHKEWRRQEVLKRAIQKNDPPKDAADVGVSDVEGGQGDSVAGEVGGGDTVMPKLQKANKVLAKENKGKNSITITTEHLEELKTALSQVCMVCLGKYTLSNLLVLNVIDKLMSMKHNDEAKKAAGVDVLSSGYSGKKAGESSPLTLP